MHLVIAISRFSSIGTLIKTGWGPFKSAHIRTIPLFQTSQVSIWVGVSYIPITAASQGTILRVEQNSTPGILPLETHVLEWSDPRVCVEYRGDSSLPYLIEWGHMYTSKMMTRKKPSKMHLALVCPVIKVLKMRAAAVDLITSGQGDRFIEYVNLRDFQDLTVSNLGGRMLPRIPKE